MTMLRIAKHLCTGQRHLRRVFPPHSQTAIAAAVRHAETLHSGEIRFAVEASLEVPALLHGQTAQTRAMEIFSQLRVWDTEHNNGVLIYLLLADREIEIVADRGIHQWVGNAEWESICRAMETAFKDGDFTEGVVRGIASISRHLAEHFPAAPINVNEMPDQPVILD